MMTMSINDAAFATICNQVATQLANQKTAPESKLDAIQGEENNHLKKQALQNKIDQLDYLIKIITGINTKRETLVSNQDDNNAQALWDELDAHLAEIYQESQKRGASKELKQYVAVLMNHQCTQMAQTYRAQHARSLPAEKPIVGSTKKPQYNSYEKIKITTALAAEPDAGDAQPENTPKEKSFIFPAGVNTLRDALIGKAKALGENIRAYAEKNEKRSSFGRFFYGLIESNQDKKDRRELIHINAILFAIGDARQSCTTTTDNETIKKKFGAILHAINSGQIYYSAKTQALLRGYVKNNYPSDHKSFAILFERKNHKDSQKKNKQQVDQNIQNINADHQLALTQKDSEIAQLKMTISEKDVTICQKDKEILELTQALDKEKKLNADTKTPLAEAQNALKAERENNEKLRKELILTRTVQSTLQNENKRLETEIATLKKQLEASNKAQNRSSQASGRIDEKAQPYYGENASAYEEGIKNSQPAGSPATAPNDSSKITISSKGFLATISNALSPTKKNTPSTHNKITAAITDATCVTPNNQVSGGNYPSYGSGPGNTDT